ncbi:S-layer homology domain-containing protein [Dysosmobacter sp.]|uniref:S-layer homology domain-containing protein n=1 Tax=Dysosmobacter sp. TaxID=2591382 RepID=UPI002637130D|nr:S-layer homology domain-containing protein [Dysosmobacter sp.]
MKQRNLASLLLAGAMTAALLTGPAQAAESPSPQEIAATRLQAEGLMNGDEHGDLHLDKGLTRAELACLISPIVLSPEHVAWERDYYAKLCTTNFSDVPEWAQVAVGVCVSMGVVAGYGNGRFGSNDPVSPQMACTIMLRYLERDGWTYATACGKAVELGLAQAETLEGETITRGDMALLLAGSLDYLTYLQTL